MGGHGERGDSATVTSFVVFSICSTHTAHTGKCPHCLVEVEWLGAEYPHGIRKIQLVGWGIVLDNVAWSSGTLRHVL